MGAGEGKQLKDWGCPKGPGELGIPKDSSNQRIMPKSPSMRTGRPQLLQIRTYTSHSPG